MRKITCKNEDEVIQIITNIQIEFPNIDEDIIERAIESCCVKNSIVKINVSFMDCVKERIRMLK